MKKSFKIKIKLIFICVDTQTRTFVLYNIRSVWLLKLNEVTYSHTVNHVEIKSGDHATDPFFFFFSNYRICFVVFCITWNVIILQVKTG